jgi:hypothetical protein
MIQFFNKFMNRIQENTLELMMESITQLMVSGAAHRIGRASSDVQ